MFEGGRLNRASSYSTRGNLRSSHGFLALRLLVIKGMNVCGLVRLRQLVAPMKLTVWASWEVALKEKHAASCYSGLVRSQK